MELKSAAGLWALLIVGSYCLGSVLFCRAIPWALTREDIFQLGDGNPGATNVFQNFGLPLGWLCLFCDLAKGFFPVFLARRLLGWQSWPFALVMAAPVAGHGYPVFHRFRGGKCIATIFGVLLALIGVSPAVWILAVLYTGGFLLLGRKLSRPVLGMLTFGLFAAISVTVEVAFGRPSVAAGCALVSVISFLRHWQPLAGKPVRHPRREQGGY